MNSWTRCCIIALLLSCQFAESLGAGGTSVRQDKAVEWQQLLDQRLPRYGHRNWIVVADSAYPAQSRPGIETIVTDADQLEVTRAVLDRLGKCEHVRPIVYLDAELPFVAERDAAGIEKYRERLADLLDDRRIESLEHEQIIDKLDEAGEKFNVLILKTNMTLPYTSVFLELDCGYWSADAEQKLRENIRAGKKGN